MRRLQVCPQPWHVAARDVQNAWRGLPARQSSSCRVLTGGRRSTLLMPACLLLAYMRIRQRISCAATVQHNRIGIENSDEANCPASHVNDCVGRQAKVWGS